MLSRSFSALFLAVLFPALPSPATAQDVQTIRASSRIVVVDVVVTDKNRNPIRNLKAGDFTLQESGKPQAITHFEEHYAPSPQDQAKLPPAPKMNPGTFTNYSPAPPTGALNVLLLDSLNTPLDAQAFVQEEILRYLKAAHPGSRMAIFGLSSQLTLLQGFTSNQDLLRNVLSGRKGSPQGSPLPGGPQIGADDPMEALADVLGNSPGADVMLAHEQQFASENQSFQQQLRTQYTLTALNQLGRYLSGLPGRKNLIWFSASFPVNILPDGSVGDPFSATASYEDEFRQTTNLLARSQVAVYPIDARGLMGMVVNDASLGDGSSKNSARASKDMSAFLSKTASEHSTMLQMAQDTGGAAALNTNGLKEAVEEAVTSGANYYTLTYTPADRNWKGDYRKISVALAKQGYTLSYRRGYYADDPDAPVHHGQAPASATAPVRLSAMQAAMVWGGPDPTQIVFQASINPSYAETEAAPAPGNKPSPKATGPYRRYAVVFAADPKTIDFAETPDGEHHAKIEFVTFVYDANGALVNSIGSLVDADLSPERYASVRHTGVQFRQQISVPAKGRYFLRIGVHDANADRVGAIEIPVSDASRQPPLSTQPPPQ